MIFRLWFLYFNFLAKLILTLQNTIWATAVDFFWEEDTYHESYLGYRVHILTEFLFDLALYVCVTTRIVSWNSCHTRPCTFFSSHLQRLSSFVTQHYNLSSQKSNIIEDKSYTVDEGNRLLRNFGTYQSDYTASQHRTWLCS